MTGNVERVVFALVIGGLFVMTAAYELAMVVAWWATPILCAHVWDSATLYGHIGTCADMTSGRTT